ncbi:uncharacterized protein LOC143145587 isoform X2 [Ptiloglossa arizonensis]|uniref:uncharacterized protein LOC143145587 isoform X2 n=1 Tax=Ptiloglossa arizonensis TaxID=3350558 RepID=UPI003F9F9539
MADRCTSAGSTHMHDTLCPSRRYREEVRTSFSRFTGRFVLSDRMNPLPLAPNRRAPSRPLDKNRLTGMLRFESRCTAANEEVRWGGEEGARWDTERRCYPNRNFCLDFVEVKI